MTDFDMPPASAGFPARGRWLIDRLMADLDLTENQAAGIVGNLGFESGGLVMLQERSPIAGRGGWGWAQWTGPRRVAFESWAWGKKLDPDSDEANYGYLLDELQNAYRSTVVALREKESITNAVFSVGQTYERPGGTTPDHLPGFQHRVTYAMRALAGPLDRITNAQPADTKSDNAHPVAEPAYLIPVLELDVPERKALQRGLGVRADGDIGPITRAALEQNRGQL